MQPYRTISKFEPGFIDQYFMYLRKSRVDIEAEARGEGETLARHERILTELARALNIPIAHIFTEGVVSGETISDRPVMQQVLDEVERGIWTGGIVMEVERLARGDTADQGAVAKAFKYSNTKIITPVKTYDPNNEFDEEYFEFGLFMSRREHKTINRRLQNGRIASVSEGKWVTYQPPYGYKRKKLEREKGFTLEIVPEEAAVVKMIFELYTIGEEQENKDGNIIIKRLGSTLICKKLNGLNIPSSTGKKWIPAVVLDILKNPVYTGKIRSNYKPQVKKMQNGVVVKTRARNTAENWKLNKGLHPAIIDMELFEKTQYLLKQKRPNPIPSNKTIKSPIMGLVYCGVCGAKMVRRPYPNRTPDALMCPVSGCENVSSYLTYVEDRIIASLRQWLTEYTLKLTIENKAFVSNAEIEVKKQTIKKLEDEITNLNKQLNNVHDLLEQGIYATETFIERSVIIHEKINNAKNNLDILNKSLEDDSKTRKNLVEFIPKVEHILEVYYSIEEPAGRNELLNEVISKAIYTKLKRVYNTGNFDNFELIVFPKTPK